MIWAAEETLATSSSLLAQEIRDVCEVELEAGIHAIWNAFTTTKGLQF